MKILFMGRKLVAADCLKFLVSRPEVEVVGVITDSHLAISPTSEVAKSHKIPILTFEQALAMLADGKLKYDLGLSMLFWRKLKQELLTTPLFGNINFHPAPLPEYKGVGGYNLAILQSLDKWAVSAHYIDSGIDTGPIISVKYFPIDIARETAKSLESKSQAQLLDLFVDVVTQCIENRIAFNTQANGAGTYLNRVQLEELKRVDLQHDDIDRKIRAFWFPPYDGAYIEVNGERYTLTNRQILEDLADPNASSLFSPPKRGRG